MLQITTFDPFSQTFRVRSLPADATIDHAFREAFRAYAPGVNGVRLTSGDRWRSETLLTLSPDGRAELAPALRDAYVLMAVEDGSAIALFRRTSVRRP